MQESSPLIQHGSLAHSQTRDADNAASSLAVEDIRRRVAVNGYR